MSGDAISGAIFIAIIIITLGITYWAHRSSKSASGFYAAGGKITASQNGVAIAGDYLSAASFLGTIAIFLSLGDDGLLYVVGGAAGWPLVLLLIAKPLRNLGRYTFSDVLSVRLSERPMRLITAISTLFVAAGYLISQMVGGGTLISALFPLTYDNAVICFGVLMIFYVAYGGMTATTWIQIIKALMLLSIALVMTVLALSVFGYSFQELFGAAAVVTNQEKFAARPALLPDGFSAFSLGLAFALGPAGLPHVLMRFFTVKDGETARRSLGIAATIIAIFQGLVLTLGYMALASISGNPQYTTPEGGIIGGGNMATLHLASYLGGNVMLGFVAAVSFATILAVVAGVTLAAATAVSRDLYRTLFAGADVSEAREVVVSKIAAIAIGIFAIVMGLVFQHENIGFLATLPLVIAASVNCPLILLTIYWKGLTTRGAVTGGSVGLILSVVPIVLSEKVWVGAFGFQKALFPYEYPTALSLTAAVVTAVVVSWLDNSANGQRERAAFAAQSLQSLQS